MKAIIALLVMVAVSAAASYQWWDSGDAPWTEGGYGCHQEMSQMSSLDSVWVYTTEEVGIGNVGVYTLDWHGGTPAHWTHNTALGVYDAELHAYRYCLNLQHVDNWIGVSLPMFKLKATDEDLSTTHTWVKPGQYWELAAWEAWIVFFGEGTVALERDTWASIKSAF